MESLIGGSISQLLKEGVFLFCSVSCYGRSSKPSKNDNWKSISYKHCYLKTLRYVYLKKSVCYCLTLHSPLTQTSRESSLQGVPSTTAGARSVQKLQPSARQFSEHDFTPPAAKTCKTSHLNDHEPFSQQFNMLHTYKRAGDIQS